MPPKAKARVRVSPSHASTDANKPQIEFRDDLGQPLWLITPGEDTPTAVVGIDDLAEATLRTGPTAANEGRRHANLDPNAEVQEYITQNNLQAPVAQTEALVRAIFGPQASVRPLLEIDPESGTLQLVIEAHYGIVNPAEHNEEMVAHHSEFTRRFAREIEFPVSPQPALLWIPTDAD